MARFFLKPPPGEKEDKLYLEIPVSPSEIICRPATEDDKAQYAAELEDWKDKLPEGEKAKAELFGVRVEEKKPAPAAVVGTGVIGGQPIGHPANEGEKAEAQKRIQPSLANDKSAGMAADGAAATNMTEEERAAVDEENRKGAEAAQTDGGLPTDDSDLLGRSKARNRK